MQSTRLQIALAVTACMLVSACTTSESVRRIEGEPRVINAEPDKFGRQLHEASHSMTPQTMEEIRLAVPKFESMDNAKIMWFMNAMGPNYTWYISDADTKSRYGVLVLAHGFTDRGDLDFGRQLQPIATKTPTAMALGMSMASSDHIQLGINNLEAAGATDIIVVPAVSTRHSTMSRQWDYVFGFQAEPEYATVPRAGSNARLHFVQPLEDHPLVGDTLLDYAREISIDPQREEVIIVAHGPVLEEDNKEQLAMLGRLADYVAERSDFAAIRVATLQDDASPELREENVKKLRVMVADAVVRGRDVLIVTNLLGTRTVQSSLRRDLRGLNYRFNRKGLMQHPNFIRWIEESVAEVVAATDREQPAG